MARDMKSDKSVDKTMSLKKGIDTELDTNKEEKNKKLGGCP